MEKEITLSSVFRYILRHVKETAFSAIAFLIVGLIYISSLDPIFTSNSTIKLKGQSNGGVNNSILNNYASLAGIDFASRSGFGSSDLIEFLSSKDFMLALLQDEEIRNSLTKDMTPDDSMDNQQIYKKYLEKVDLKKKRETDSIILSVNDTSPNFSYYLNKKIIEIGDKVLKEKQLFESKSALDYLAKISSNSYFLNVRQAINDLTKMHLEKYTLAQIKGNFLIEVVDSPEIPKYKSAPSRLKIIFGFLIMGVFLGLTMPMTIKFFKEL